MFLDTLNLSFDVKPAAFENMLNLRLLKIYCSSPEIRHRINFREIHSLPNELRLLHWENYPLQFLPEHFDPMNLVEINMPHSQLQKLWGGTKVSKLSHVSFTLSDTNLNCYFLFGIFFSEPGDAKDNQALSFEEAGLY